MEQCMVVIGASQWVGYLATGPYELSSGLSGVSSMPAGTGMLLDIGWENPVTITTEQMQFPIDIIWISEALVVVRVDRSVEPGNLITDTCRYVFEVNSGEAEGINTGDAVSIWVLQLPVSTLAEMVTPLATMAIISGVAAPIVAAVTSAMAGSKKSKKPKPAVARIVTVPGGSQWKCIYCGKTLQPKEKAVKVGSDVVCNDCVQKGKLPRQSIPVDDKIRLSKKYGTWAVGLAEAMSPEGDVESVERLAKELLASRGVLVK